MADFRVDNLFTAIKSLKQERLCLEQKLTEQRKRRENLERTVDAMKSKNRQVYETKAKLGETLKVAQHKVAQTQAQSDDLHGQADGKKAKVHGLNSEIEKMRSDQHGEAEEFASQLSGVTDELMKLRETNREDHVTNILNTCESSFSDNMLQIEKTEHEITQLSTMLDDLGLRTDEDADEAEKQGIPLWQQKMVLDIFHEKINTLIRSLDMFQTKKLQLEKDHQKTQEEKENARLELLTVTSAD